MDIHQLIADLADAMRPPGAAAEAKRYLDTCPRCPPPPEGTPARTVAPHHITPDGREGITAHYRHRCGHTWTCGWLRKTA